MIFAFAFVNGFHETWSIQHAEDAFGFAKVGQTLVHVPDPKLIKLYVNDEPLLVGEADCEEYSRRCPEPPAGRSVFGRASLTVRFRPSTTEPFKPSIAALAASGLSMVTKPNPRARPVSRSIIRLVSTTVPYAAKASWRSFSVVLKERFPTNNFVLM